MRTSNRSAMSQWRWWIVSSMLQVVPEATEESGDDSLSCVPYELEIRMALVQMQDGKALGGDDISAKVLNPGGEVVVQ